MENHGKSISETSGWGSRAEPHLHGDYFSNINVIGAINMFKSAKKKLMIPECECA